MDAQKLTTWEKISLWWRFKGRYFRQDFIQGIKNLVKWFKLVWKDRDWDDTFIFEALKFKIENTAKYTERRQWFVGWEKEVSRMKTCVKLINYIQDNTYGMEYYDYQESKYEFVPSGVVDENGKSDYYEMKSEVLVDNLDEYFKRYPRIYKLVLKKYFSDLSDEDITEKRMSIAFRIGHENHERAKRLLFKILNEHIESWWD